MSAELLSVARAEEQRLLRELEATSLFRRLEAVRALLAEYESTPNITPSSHRARRPTSRKGSLTSQVIAVAEDYLRKVQRRAQSLEILRVAQEHGMEVKGEKPTTVVASILSHCDLFDNVRGKGYGLKEWSMAPTSPDDKMGSGGESEGLLGHSPTDAPNHDEPLDTDAQSGVHSNGATSGERSWPHSAASDCYTPDRQGSAGEGKVFSA
jgi:hypothetical protein